MEGGVAISKNVLYAQLHPCEEGMGLWRPGCLALCEEGEAALECLRVCKPGGSQLDCERKSKL